MLPIAAGAANVNRAFGCLDPVHPRPHGQHSAGDLRRGFAAIGQLDQRIGNLGIGHIAIEHPPKQQLSFTHRQAHARSLTAIPQIRR